MESETTLLVATISATSAIAGALISQIVLIIRDSLDKKHQRNSLLREKYEELSGHITESHAWVIENMSAQSLSQLQAQSLPAHARKAATLSHIYFPQLRNACQDYLNSCISFGITLINNYQFAEGVDIGIQASTHNREEFEKALRKVQLCRQAVDDAIIEHAHKYTKA